MATKVLMEMRETEVKDLDLKDEENLQQGVVEISEKMEPNPGATQIMERPGAPTNPMLSALLTDMYQITMAYAYWKAGKHEDCAVFDLLFRKIPFGGEFTVFAGLEECIRFDANSKFKDDDIEFLQTILPSTCEDEFYISLESVDCSEVEIYAMPEGSGVFPRIPLMRVEGPLLPPMPPDIGVCWEGQDAFRIWVETSTGKEFCDYLKLTLDQIFRVLMEVSVHQNTAILEALTQLGRRFGIPVRGTHSHAFVSSFMSFDEITERSRAHAKGGRKCEDFVHLTQLCLGRMQEAPTLREFFHETDHSELAAFTSYALAFRTAFQVLADTYDVIRSGIPNFFAVALALHELGFKALGIRLDSGDLSYFSLEARRIFRFIEKEIHVPGFGKLVITASNDINEDTLDALNKQGHEKLMRLV